MADEKSGSSVVFKARVIGPSEVATSNKLEEDPFKPLYGEGVIEPPYDLRALTRMPEYSNILSQCLDAMETNIDGFGFTLEPAKGVVPGKDGKYSPEVEAERARAEAFFKYCNPDESFIAIRGKTRRDLHTTGNAYWEILRNGKGEICGIEHLESYTMRLTPLDPEPVDTTWLVKDGNNNYVAVPHRKRFRRFVQIRENRKVYFKEFGDPRPVDAETGRVLTEDEAKNPGVRLATEVIHWRLYCPHSPYGVPKWIGNLPSISGSRQAEEVNLEYFDNKSVPPLAILVSGRLAEDSVKRIEDYIEDNIRGRQGFHKILVIEAEAGLTGFADGNRKSGIEMKPLTDAQQKDALFQEYDRANREKVRSAFRLPPIYVGLSQDYTRATAEESCVVAEEQVFGPERDAFDWTINRVLFPAMGIRFWEFKSLAATVDNAKDQTEMLGTFIQAGMTPREARRYIEEIINRPLEDPKDADWLDMPLQVFTAKLQTGLIVQEELGEGESAVEKLAKNLIAIRKAIEAIDDGEGRD